MPPGPGTSAGMTRKSGCLPDPCSTSWCSPASCGRCIFPISSAWQVRQPQGTAFPKPPSAQGRLWLLAERRLSRKAKFSLPSKVPCIPLLCFGSFILPSLSLKPSQWSLPQLLLHTTCPSSPTSPPSCHDDPWALSSPAADQPLGSPGELLSPLPLWLLWMPMATPAGHPCSSSRTGAGQLCPPTGWTTT